MVRLDIICEWFQTLRARQFRFHPPIREAWQTDQQPFPLAFPPVYPP